MGNYETCLNGLMSCEDGLPALLIVEACGKKTAPSSPATFTLFMSGYGNFIYLELAFLGKLDWENSTAIGSHSHYLAAPSILNSHHLMTSLYGGEAAVDSHRGQTRTLGWPEAEMSVKDLRFNKTQNFTKSTALPPLETVKT